MTRKDFELIANAVRGAILLARIDTQPQHDNGDKAIETAAIFLASALATTNPRFERARFLAACGVA